MRHHHIDGREIGNGVLRNGDSAGRREMWGVVPVLVAVVGKGPVAEFGLIGGGVDLGGLMSAESEGPCPY